MGENQVINNRHQEIKFHLISVLVKAIIFSLISVVLVILYSINNISLLKINTLTMLIMILRTPGEIILEPLSQVIYRSIYEFKMGLILLTLMFLFWFPVLWIRSIIQRRRLVSSMSEIKTTQSKKKQKGFTIKRIVLSLISIFLFYIVNNSIAPRVIGQLNLAKTSIGIPLRVITEVSFEDPEIERAIAPSHCPPMLVFFENKEQINNCKDEVQRLWRENICRSNEIETSILSTQSNTAPKSSGTHENEAIKNDIKSFIRRAGGGWWRETDQGFIICLNRSVSKNSEYKGLSTKFPPLVLLSDNLNDTCSFIQNLTGVSILVYPKQIEILPLKNVIVNIPPVFPILENECTFLDVIAEVAICYQYHEEIQDKNIVLRQLKPEEIAALVKRLFETYRRKHIFSSKEPSVQLFPPQSAVAVAAYLDDPDDIIIDYALQILRYIGACDAKPELLRIMESGVTKSGKRLSGDFIDQIIRILLLDGEIETKPYLEHSSRIHRYFYEDFFTQDRIAMTTMASAEMQEWLLKKFETLPPFVIPGEMHFKQSSNCISKEDCRLVESKALLFLNSFVELSREPEASARLYFSDNCQVARYHLELYYYIGPLNARGIGYEVILERIGNKWIITQAKHGGMWIS